MGGPEQGPLDSQQRFRRESRSQRILEALSDIKHQLQNEEIAPQELEENSLKIKETKKEKSHDLDFKNLQQKIENLEHLDV